MPIVTRANGDVVSVSRSGGTRIAKIRFPSDPPPPDFGPEVSFEVDAEDAAALRAALLATPPGKVDVTSDDATNPARPAAITVHR